jgi:hypothetical protein
LRRPALAQNLGDDLLHGERLPFLPRRLPGGLAECASRCPHISLELDSVRGSQGRADSLKHPRSGSKEACRLLGITMVIGQATEPGQAFGDSLFVP